MKKKLQGIVKWFNDSKGFGFITPSDGSRDVFVHYTQITGEGFKALAEGATVEYELDPNLERGPQALSVTIVKGN